MSIYDFSIRRMAFPFLEHQPSELPHIKAQAVLTAADVMSPDPVMLPAVIK